MVRKLTLAALVGLIAGSGLAWGWVRLAAWRVVTSRLSPDETLRALVVEPTRPGSDRTIQVRLEALVDGRTTILLRSPEVGGPGGTERLVWSKDGTMILLVGRHFFVRDDLFLDNGDQLFFLHHVPTGRSWINSAEAVGLPDLDASTIRGVEFTEPIRLR